jgi:LPS sulfotransferase NodH
MKLIVPETKDVVHLPRLLSRFGSLDLKGALPLPPSEFIFICFTNRCGSNYLAELLASSKDYNLAGEFLNWDTVCSQSDKHGFQTFHDYFAWLTSQHSKSGRMILKIAISQVELLSKSGILDSIAARSKFLLIERSDKLGQAISYAIAFATGRFTSEMQGTKNAADVEFSVDLVDRILKGIILANMQFDTFFSFNGILPINITYEQLSLHPDIYAGFAAQGLGLNSFRIAKEHLRLERQTSSINDIWRTKYLNRCR